RWGQRTRLGSRYLPGHCGKGMILIPARPGAIRGRACRMGSLAPQRLVITQPMEGYISMKLTLRLLTWMMAVLGVTGWAAASEPLPTYVSHKNLESTVQAQSAELLELRARLASLEREIANVDSSPSDRYVLSSGPGTCQSSCIPQECC